MTYATNHKVFSLCDEKTMRFDNVIYLAAVLPSTDGMGSIPESMEGFIDQEISDIVATFGKLPNHVEYYDEDMDDFGELLIEWMIAEDKFGFLVQAATPIMMPKTGAGSSYSWGYYATMWIYAETMEEAVTRSAEWVDSVRKKEAAEAAAKA